MAVKGDKGVLPVVVTIAGQRVFFFVSLGSGAATCCMELCVGSAHARLLSDGTIYSSPYMTSAVGGHLIVRWRMTLKSRPLLPESLPPPRKRGVTNHVRPRMIMETHLRFPPRRPAKNATVQTFARPNQTSGLWVRVLYRGDSAGWVLTANKRGASLTPAESGPAAAAREFQAQEAAAVAGGGGETANGAGDEDRPLTGAKAGSTAVSDDSGSAAEVARARSEAAAAAAAPPVAAGSPGKGNAASVGQFLTSAG